MSTQFSVQVVLAYLDPASGSIIFQAAVGAVMGVTLLAKVYWRKFRGFFSRTSGEVSGALDD